MSPHVPAAPSSDHESTENPLLRTIRESVIGDDHVMQTPYGQRRVTYADYTASSGPWGSSRTSSATRCCPHANTHTESSGTGLQTTRLREDAREIIEQQSVHGDDDTVVVFAGSGCTG